ncbi:MULTISPECIES: porin [Paraburkholderia]|uniref:porin n=1 Tax=Paraburkholderia TaxID=1822464 RepID=UPI002258DB08|nr:MULTISPECIES: porin [Paraburkholderia]MCX4160920.1 porin [Paraburkholderia megapolitana]MDN7156416.1 porin [Paraburkholderia sp. CHISQ3]MDQ6493461.1 porin [Paraburkholderia megapolitana]
MNRQTSAKVTICMALACGSSVASAQSSVTLYGVIDAGIRYETHGVSYDGNGTPVSTGRQISMINGGGLAESYWGLKGQEDLGGGMQALFDVESHFDPGSGSVTPYGSENFFQTSYVGLLSPTLGQLTLGRQYNVGLESAAISYASNLWAGPQDPSSNIFKPENVMLAGSRTNNMIQYAAQLGSTYFLAQYALGGHAGSGELGSQIGAALAYAPDHGPFAVSASFLRTWDDITHGKLDIFSGGGSVNVGKVSLNAGYLINTRDNDFTSFESGPFSPGDLAALGFISPAQVANPATPGGFSRRRMILAGLAYHVTPAFIVALNGWWTSQSGYTTDFNGSAHQYQAIAAYNLSRRDTLYAEVDYSIYRGGAIGAQLVGINGQAPSISTTQTGMMVGLRHYF